MLITANCFITLINKNVLLDKNVIFPPSILHLTVFSSINKNVPVKWALPFGCSVLEKTDELFPALEIQGALAVKSIVPKLATVGDPFEEHRLVECLVANVSWIVAFGSELLLLFVNYGTVSDLARAM